MVSTEILFGKLTFCLVNFNELNPRTNYMIRIGQCINGYYCYVDGKFLEYQTNINTNSIVAKMHVRDIFDNNRCVQRFTNCEQFYQLVPKKYIVQQAMEKRALQLILQSIVGDKYFYYEY